jgi:hypothetical protein
VHDAFGHLSRRRFRLGGSKSKSHSTMAASLRGPKTRRIRSQTARAYFSTLLGSTTMSNLAKRHSSRSRRSLRQPLRGRPSLPATRARRARVALVARAPRVLLRRALRRSSP